MNINLTPLLKSIFDYDPDGPNIHHLMAVHGYSRLIAQMENVDGHTLFITEVAAYLHDIGVKVSKEKYGNSQPQHQEAEGPAIAQMENVDGHTLFITEVAAYVLYRERYGRLLQARVRSNDERKCVQDCKRKISSGTDV